jgi:hypothetical protein
MCGSTCFGRLSAHHQEHTTALGASGFTVGVWQLKCCWSWSHDQQSSNGKTRGSDCSCTLLMMGGEAPETCWATYKRQVVNLWNCCILLVDLFEWKMWFRNGCQVDFSIIYRRASHTRKILRSVPVLLLWSRYTLEDWGTVVRFPAGAQVFLFSTVSRPVLGPTRLIKWTMGIVSSWPNCSGHKPDPLPSPNVKVNNAWSCISTPSYVFMIREYFTLNMCLWYGTLWSYSSTVTYVRIFFNRWTVQCDPINCNPFCQKGKTLSHSRHLNWIVLRLAAEIRHLTTWIYMYIFFTNQARLTSQ